MAEPQLPEPTRATFSLADEPFLLATAAFALVLDGLRRPGGGSANATVLPLPLLQRLPSAKLLPVFSELALGVGGNEGAALVLAAAAAAPCSAAAGTPREAAQPMRNETCFSWHFATRLQAGAPIAVRGARVLATRIPEFGYYYIPWSQLVARDHNDVAHVRCLSLILPQVLRYL